MENIEDHMKMDTKVAKYEDASGLEEWLSEVAINDDENPRECETLVIDLPDSAYDPPLPPPPATPKGDGVDDGLLGVDTPMEATSASIVTPMMSSDAKKMWMETFGPSNSTVTPDVVEARLKMMAEKVAMRALMDTPTRQLYDRCPCDFPDYCDVCIEREVMENNCECAYYGMNHDRDVCDFCYDREQNALKDVRKNLFGGMDGGDGSGEGVDGDDEVLAELLE